MVKRYELTQRQWETLAPLLPGKAGDRGRTGADNRAFLNGVLWVLRSGARWSDLPARYGENWKTVHKRFTRWANGGVWEQVFRTLSAEPDNEYRMIDRTIIRAHQSAASGKGGACDQALGRSRGGLTSKIHLLPTALAEPSLSR